MTISWTVAQLARRAPAGLLLITLGQQTACNRRGREEADLKACDCPKQLWGKQHAAEGGAKRLIPTTCGCRDETPAPLAMTACSRGGSGAAHLNACDCPQQILVNSASSFMQQRWEWRDSPDHV